MIFLARVCGSRASDWSCRSNIHVCKIELDRDWPKSSLHSVIGTHFSIYAVYSAEIPKQVPMTILLIILLFQQIGDYHVVHLPVLIYCLHVSHCHINCVFVQSLVQLRIFFE